MIGEGVTFFTCGDYDLCKTCKGTNKPCHNHQEYFKNEHLEKVKLNKYYEQKELDAYFKEFYELMDYYDYGE